MSTQLLNLFFKFFRRPIIFFPIRFRLYFSFFTSWSSKLPEIFTTDVLPPVCVICNTVDETEEIVNISRSKSCTLVCPGVLITSFTHWGLCGGVHFPIFIVMFLFSSNSSTSFGNILFFKRYPTSSNIFKTFVRCSFMNMSPC